METAKLLARRQVVLERHKVLESVPGSSWHPNDPDSLTRHRLGEMPLSKRPIALLDDDRVHVVGECFLNVVAWLKAWLPEGRKLVKPGQRADILDSVRTVEQVLEGEYTQDEGERLTMPTRKWNACLYALTAVHVQAILTDAHEGEE